MNDQDHSSVAGSLRDSALPRHSQAGSATPSYRGAHLWPVYEFRPLPGALPQGWDVYRFADGAWLPDDGEYDLAFSAWNTCLMVEPQYQRNILWSWLNGSWGAFEPSHPRGNPWHYHLREGETVWGGDWGRDTHPNYLAGRAGMSWTCSRFSCANGRHVDFKADDPHILAGLVRRRDTKEVVTVPADLTCMYCGCGPRLKASQSPVTSDGEVSKGGEADCKRPNTTPQDPTQ